MPASIELNLVDLRRKKPEPPEPQPVEATGERRRAAKVVHDERGTARVEWRDAPPDEERVPLSIADPAASGRDLARRGEFEVLSFETGEAFNPYDRAPGPVHKERRAQKTDLRKLSEWIKMMRELEERKRRGDGTDEE